MEILKKGECAHNLDNTTICMDDDVIKKISTELINKKQLHHPGKLIDNIKNIENIKKIVDCDSESCILTKPIIHNIIGAHAANNQLTTKFKPAGPHDSNDWFSNISIDGVLKQVSKKDPTFKHVPFQMVDFEESNTELSKINFVNEYNKGIRSFGVVFNTYYSSGNGKHWYAVFGDFRQKPFTLEYFNSSGSAPQTQITKWLNETKFKLIEGLKLDANNVNVVRISDIQYQNDHHSCGSYALYYIIHRIAKISPTEIKKTLNDTTMHEFRKEYLFRKSK